MRAGYLDALRGLAVVWMVIFHATYDLFNFGYNHFDFHHGFWYGFPRVIAFTFLFCVGVSLNYTHVPHLNWHNLLRRTLKIGAGALVISLTTWFMFPTQWVYFGTLHCIMVGSILGALVVNHRRLSLVLMILILIGQYVLPYDIQWVSSVIKKPSMDFIPIYPWFWAILLGILAGPWLQQKPFFQKFPSPRWLTFLGRHSLKIYLLHQPLIFGILSLYQTLNP